MIHDCIYQFLRLFYHSRFKPQQLEMTTTQLLVPVFDLVLVLPLILRLFKDFSRFSNATKMKIQSKPEINGSPLMSTYYMQYTIYSLRYAAYHMPVIKRRRFEPRRISNKSFSYTPISIFHQ